MALERLSGLKQVGMMMTGQRIGNWTTLVLSILLGLLGSRLEARPEYALRHRINQCTACHISPTGGGMKTLQGKDYGARQFGRFEWPVSQYVSIDTRMLYYQAALGESGRGGLGVMAVNLGAYLPIDRNEKIQLVIEKDLAGFGGQSRDTYLRHQFHQWDDYGWRPSILQIGRFHIPLGIVTDEHKTYIRQQSASTWNDFETGLLAAGDVSDSFHYDLALLNRVRSAGATASEGGAQIWGGLANLRWMPRRLPLLLGTSANYHNEVSGKPSPWVSSIYSMLSLDRMTGQRVSGTFLAEISMAEHFNPLIQRFINDSAYVANVSETRSRGILMELEWNVTSRWTLIYKYDELVLDINYPGDGYTRHGVGAQYVMGANALVRVRLDHSVATPAAEANSTLDTATDAGWVQVQVSL